MQEKAKVKKYQKEIFTTTTSLESVKQKMEAAQLGREASAKRESQLEKLKILGKEKVQLQQRLDMNKANDPAQLEELAKGITTLKEGCNRWIDNIWEMKKYVIDKFNMEAVVVSKPRIPYTFLHSTRLTRSVVSLTNNLIWEGL